MESGRGVSEIEAEEGEVSPSQKLGEMRARIYADLEERQRRVEEDDQRRIEAGDTAPWLGRRATWLNPN